MFIREDHRSDGVGRQLYEEFEEWAKENESNRLRVVASAHNVGAIRFYEGKDIKSYDWVGEKDLS